MDENINQLFKFVFDLQNLWLLLFSIIVYLIFKIYDIHYHIKLTNKLEKKIQDQVENKVKYSETELHLKNLLTQNQNIDVDFKSFQDQLLNNILILDKELDNISKENSGSPIFSSGLSKKAADDIIMSLIRKIYFKYWQMHDIVQLADPTKKDKYLIANNLSEYANLKIFDYLSLLKLDDKIKKLFDKSKIEKRNKLINAEDMILFRDLISTN